MKKVLLSLALVFQVVFVASAHQKSNNPEHTIYKQPSKETEVVKVLTKSDNVVVVRPFNDKWSIVTVNNQVGYIRNFQLAQHKRQLKAAAIARAKAAGNKPASRS